MVKSELCNFRSVSFVRHAETILVVISLKYHLRFLRTWIILICVRGTLYSEIKDIENIAPGAFYREVLFL